MPSSHSSRRTRQTPDEQAAAVRRRRQSLAIRALVALAAAVAAGCGTETGTGPAAGAGPADDDTGAGPAPLAHPVTVSGVSSGAYMAVQTHVALAERVAGAGAIAGGPYHCAEGRVAKALSACLSGEALDVQPLVRYASDHTPVAALAGDRVWLFHSPADGVVAPATSAAAAAFYREFIAAERIALVDDVAAAHGWPTLATGVACDEMGGDYINACDYDAAGEMLAHLYGRLAPRAAAAPALLRTVDLSQWLPPGSGMADSGFAFVPEECDGAGDCRLHIAFHGCRMGAEFIEDRFARGAGLNEWAATNRIVVLYPQVEKGLTNPQGCWDWWGYTGEAYDRPGGRQISAVDAMISGFASGDLLP